ncbi:MAG TPA: hypothetical protein PLG97_06005 [Alcaligenes sp.]|nr:hypothetical protein [Alcaligenes sp.]HRL27053.1 hypothetical protein [Alcaligenes sp.]
MNATLRPLLDLHPSLWTAQHWSRPGSACLPSGFPVLDAELPDGGWPTGHLIELLCSADCSPLSLLLPAINTIDAQRLRVLIAPPYQPVHSLWQAPNSTMGAGASPDGMPPSQSPAPLLWIRCQHASDTVWACAQALRHGHCAAILTWLPTKVPPAALRQLQLLASQSDSLFICLRPLAAQHAPSPALLRLQLDTRQDAQGQAWLDVHIRKRRGPPCLQPIALRPPHRLAASTPDAHRHGSLPVSTPARSRQAA